MAPKITVRTPSTNPRIIIESEYGTVELRPVNLDNAEVLLVNAFIKGNAEIEVQ